MSVKQPANDSTNVDEGTGAEDLQQDWIEQVEHEETIAPEVLLHLVYSFSLPSSSFLSR